MTDKEKEVEFLRKVADVLILILLPKSYLNCLGMRSSLRELLSRQVLYNAIDSITSPKSINHFLKWIVPDQTDSSVDKVTEKKKGLEIDLNNQDSYNNFIETLNSSEDAEYLKEQRSNILTEIIRATTIEDKSNNDVVTQLVKAKTVTDYRLEVLGCDPSVKLGNENGKSPILDEIDGRQNLSFAAIMKSAFSRRYFYAFLESNYKREELLGFWSSVQELRDSNKTEWHQIATEIFYTYINKPTRVIRMSKTWLKQIESFLMGDSGPDVFYEIQADVFRTLETDFYPSFLVSDHCYSMLEDALENNILFDDDDKSGIDNFMMDLDHGEKKRHSNDDSPFRNHVAKAFQVKTSEKLQNKVQALKALQNSLQPDSKVLKLLQEQVNETFLLPTIRNQISCENYLYFICRLQHYKKSI